MSLSIQYIEGLSVASTWTCTVFVGGAATVCGGMPKAIPHG